MKILMVNKFLYPAGGAETYMFKLGAYLTSLGHRVEYFGMYSKDNCVSNSIDCYTDNIDFRNAGAMDKIRYSLKTIYSKEAAVKIGRVIDNFKPDIVHLNNINFQLTPSIIYEIKKHSIPIVQTVHDVQIACPNHRMYNEEAEKICTDCSSGKYINCTKHKCLHGSLLKSFIASIESYYYHSKNTYNLVDAYICPSRFMADTIANAGIDKRKITVIHNYCEKQVLSETRTDSNNYVLYFGRLSIEKGIKTLIDVCRDLPEINFVFAGTGPLEHLCKDIENIHYTGFKTGDELNALIENAAFTVCPSECHENCPMSILESLSLGTPVIGSDLGGIPELIAEGVTGEIFKAGNKKDLREKIANLYGNKALLAEMSANCIRLSNNTLESYTENLIKIYSNLRSKNG